MATFRVWPLGWHEDRSSLITADGPGEAATLYADSEWTKEIGDGPRALLVRDSRKKNWPLIVVYLECKVRRNYTCYLSYEINELTAPGQSK